MRGKFQGESKPGNPLVSIITVVKDDEKHLERTIRSVVNQSYDNIEYIIIDGASTDGAVDIIRKYEDSIDYWVSEADNGIYDAMNKGVNFASGDWIYFLGCNDILLDNLSYIAINFKDSNTIYYGDVYYRKLHKIYDGRFNAYKLMLKNICHQSVFYPQKVFGKYSFDQRYKSLADYVLNVKCYGDKDLNFAYLPILVAVFNDDRKKHGIDSEFEKDRKQIIRANFSTQLFSLFCLRFTLVKLLEKVGIKKTLKSILNR
jgi:glycosyltransferase involved in cell wall biosynthesis